MSDDPFLGRWSRRKSIARAGGTPPPEPAPAAPAAVAAPAIAPPAAPPPDLPAVESLTAESDFAPFMRVGVDPQVKRDALKVLLRDPRFNVMDGLDVYIDDYSKPDPLPEGWLEKLNQMAFLGDATPAPADDAQAQEKPGEPAAAQAADAPDVPAESPASTMEEASSGDAAQAAPEMPRSTT